MVFTGGHTVKLCLTRQPSRIALAVQLQAHRTFERVDLFEVLSRDALQVAVHAGGSFENGQQLAVPLYPLLVHPLAFLVEIAVQFRKLLGMHSSRDLIVCRLGKRVFGRNISKWWLLLLAPISLLCIPVLLLGLIVGGHVVGGIFGPPALWERTRNSPPRADLVGDYIEAERHWDHFKTGPNASLALRPDGSMAVHALPLDDGMHVCILSGTGKWEGPRKNQELELDLISDGAPDSCKSGNYDSLRLAGNSTPYRLYWVLSDPDSGTGIWFKRQ